MMSRKYQQTYEIKKKKEEEEMEKFPATLRKSPVRATSE